MKGTQLLREETTLKPLSLIPKHVVIANMLYCILPEPLAHSGALTQRLETAWLELLFQLWLRWRYTSS